VNHFGMKSRRSLLWAILFRLSLTIMSTRLSDYQYDLPPELIADRAV
jgi:hypothetical protein